VTKHSLHFSGIIYDLMFVGHIRAMNSPIQNWSHFKQQIHLFDVNYLH